jgi:hypothetical protein
LSEIKVLATGEAAVIKFLEAQGVPDFGIPSMLESSECNPGRWPWGAQVSTSVDTENPEAVMVTVTYQEGVFRIESGPAADYFAHADGDDTAD